MVKIRDLWFKLDIGIRGLVSEIRIKIWINRDN